jgi:hypothetical protein
MLLLLSLSLFIHLAAKVYHVCALDKTFSFLCPNGTIFDQRVFVCRWWHNVDCASSENYYNLNDLIGISPATQQPAVRNPIHFPSATSYGPAAPTKLVVQQQQQQQQQHHWRVAKTAETNLWAPTFFGSPSARFDRGGNPTSVKWTESSGDSTDGLVRLLKKQEEDV